MATHSSILVWRIPWTQEPGRLQFIKSQSQTWLSDWVCTSVAKTACFLWRKEGFLPSTFHLWVTFLRPRVSCSSFTSSWPHLRAWPQVHRVTSWRKERNWDRHAGTGGHVSGQLTAFLTSVLESPVGRDLFLQTCLVLCRPRSEVILNPKPSCGASVYSTRALNPRGLWFTHSWRPVGFGCLGPGELWKCFSLCVSITSISYDHQVLKCLFLLSLGHSYDLFYSHVLNQEMIIRKTRSEQQEGKSPIWVVGPTAVREMSFAAPASVHPYTFPSHIHCCSRLFSCLYGPFIYNTYNFLISYLIIVYSLCLLLTHSLSLQSCKFHEGTGFCLSCSVINLKFQGQYKA